MAVPKRKVSRARAHRRKAHAWRLRLAPSSICPNCGARKEPHHICPSCGWYRGRQIEQA